MKGMRPATQFLACWLVFGAAGWAQTIDLSRSEGRWMLDGASASVRFGAWLHVGDLTGDFDNKELIVGSPGDTSDRGAVRIFQRSSSTPFMFATMTGGVAGDRFGSAADAGFVINREIDLVHGRPAPGAPISPRDLIVGAPGAFGGRGAVYVLAGPFARNGNRTAADADIQVLGAQATDALGTIVESADLNGDGHRELVLPVPSRGVIYVLDVYNAPSSTIDLSVYVPGMIISGLGMDIAIATGDVTGDGIFDLAVGDPDAQTARGRVYLVRGARAALPPTRSFPAQAEAQLTGVDPGDRIGDSLWIADIDDDGDDAAELIIGAPGADALNNAKVDAGEVFVIWGRSDITSVFRVGLHLSGAGAGHRLGSRVTAGDINRDSPDDVTMLASGANGGKGEIFVYFGRHDYEFTTPLDMATSASRRVRGDSSSGAIETVRVWEATGEGAEEILAGVPSASTSGGATAGRVYLALSPSFQVSGSVAMATGEGGTATSTQPIGNQSQVPIQWQATASEAWLTVSPSTGITSATAPVTIDVTVNADIAGPGSHTGEINIASKTMDVRMTSTMRVSVTISESRYVAVETPAAGADLPQPFVVRGWAIDTAVSAGTGVDAVEIQGYRDPGSGSPPVVLGTATYGGARPSVGSSYGSRFTNSGFELTANGLVPGSYQIVIRARSSATGTWWNKPAGTVNVTVQRIDSPDDVNSDGITDLVWQNKTSGAVSVWLMDGSIKTGGLAVNPSPVPVSWKLGAFRDFDGDGKPDMLWHDQSTGALIGWVMDGESRVSTVTPNPSVVGTYWQIVAAADFTGDGETDLLWRSQNGDLSIWQMSGFTRTSIVAVQPNRVDPSWNVVGAADFDGDANADLVWRHSGGTISVWTMDGATKTGALPLSPNFVSPAWKLSALTDVNGDARPDFLFHNQTSGNLSVWYMNGGSRISNAALSPGIVSPSWSLVAPR
jgi:hypothetical protein